MCYRCRVQRGTSLLIAFVAAVLALWAAAAGAHDGPHPAQLSASAGRANLAGAIGATQAPRALPSLTGSGSCPANDGSACCCQVDRASPPEPRLLIAGATPTIVRPSPARAQSPPPRDRNAAAPHHRVGAVGSRGPP
jgi:hypothetical protein